MQSTVTSTETDPHDIFVIEPDVVLAARVDQTPAAPALDTISPAAPPQVERAPEIAAAAAMPAVDATFRAVAGHAAAADHIRAADIQVPDIHVPDIEVPGDIRLSGKRPPRGRWVGRAVIGFVFALGSAAAAEAWDHYGDAARTMIANWTPFVLTPAQSQSPEKPAVAEQTNSPAVQATATDQAAAPAVQPTQEGTAPAAAAAAPDPAQPPTSTAQDLATMGQQIETLKASIEQLKAGQEQMAQQMAQQIARNSAARTAQAKQAQAKTPEQSLRAKVVAALSPRPATAPPRKPKPAYPPSAATMALPPQIAAPPMPPPQAAPAQYQPQAQVIDRADGDPVERPPMPVR